PRNYGPDPHLPNIQRGLLPSMKIAEPAEWGDQQPPVPDGYRVTAIATDLKIPRQTLVLPNGDILVAEGRGGSAPALQPKDVIAGVIKARGTTPVEDRKSTRLNSSHVKISYAVFCLKKKTNKKHRPVRH